MKNSAKRFITWGFLSASVCMAIFVWITYSNMQLTLKESNNVGIALKSLRVMEDVINDMQKNEICLQDYIITGNPQQLDAYHETLNALWKDSSTLHALVAEDSSRQANIKILQARLRKKIAHTDSLVLSRSVAGKEAAASIIRNGRSRQLMDDTRNLIYSIETADRKTLRESNIQRMEKARYTTILFFVLSGVFFLGFIVAYFIIQRNLLRQDAYQAELTYLSTLVKQTSEAIFSTDPAFQVRSWNKAAEKMYGYTFEEALGQKLGNLFKVQLDTEQYNLQLKALHQTGFYNGEYEVIHRTGNTIHVETSVTVLKEDNGKIAGYVAVHKDITERIKLQSQLCKLNDELEEKVAVKTAELTHIFERITDAFVALDDDWNYTYVNKKAGELMNQDPQLLIGQNIRQSFPGAFSKEFFDKAHQALARQHYVYLEDYYAHFGKWLEHNIYPSENGLSIFFRDITEKKLAEQVLKESEEKYRSLIEVASDAIFINQDGKIEYANPAALRIFGAGSPEELLGKNYIDLFHPDYHGGLQHRNGELPGQTKPGNLVEKKIIRMDGQVIDVEVVVNAFSYLGGEATQVVLRNLSERKELEKKLRASDKIFNHSVDMLCIAGLDGYFKVLNPAWTKILGWSLEEIMSKPCVSFVHPDDLTKAGNDGTAFSTTVEVTHFENRYLCSDGNYKWIAWNSFVYPGEQMIFGVGRDITVAKQYEEELFKNNQLFENLARVSPVGIFRTGAKGDCLYVNDRWCAIAGMPMEEALGDGWIKAIHPEDQQYVSDTWNNQLLGNNDFKIEYRIMRPNGSVSWVFGQAKAEYNNTGEVIGYVGTITDISEIKQAEKLIKDSAEGLKKAQHYAHLGSWTWNIPENEFNWSDEMYNIFHVDKATFQVTEDAFFSLIPNREDRLNIENNFINALAGQSGKSFEFTITGTDGHLRHIAAETGELLLDKLGNPLELSGIVQDITQRKQAEQEIIKATRLYEFISEVNQLMLRTKDQHTIFTELCRIAIQFGKFRMAWIGLIEGEESSLQPVAWAGHEMGYLTSIRPYLMKDQVMSAGPSWKAILQEKYFYCNDIEESSSVGLWKNEQLKRGYRAVVALPIFVGGEVIGAFTIYASEALFFIPSEIQLLEEVTANIGYALENIARDKKRKEAEEGLRKLSAAVEQSSASIVITDTAGAIEYVNPAFSKVTGYSFEESIGQNPRILKSGLSDSQVYEELWQNIRTAKEWNGVFCNKKKNGELYWESATISPIQNEAGEITNFVAVKENITDKIKAEEQLVKEKELSDSIINSLPGIFYLYDQSGKFMRWNKNFEIISGYSTDEMNGMQAIDFYDIEDQPRMRKRMADIFAGIKVSGTEARIVTKSGEKIPFFCNSLSIFYEGRTCILGMATDISGRKKAEEENRKLAMIASLTINSAILTDERGKIEWVNKGFERIFGFELEEVSGKDPYELLTGPETDQQTLADIHSFIRHQESFKVELVNYSKQGEKYWLDLEGVPLLNDQQKSIGYLGIQQDITERKKAEKELLILNDHLHKRATELVVSNNELERFAYVASHDLQEPLRMVSSFMQLLQKTYESKLDARANQYINFAVDGTERMRQLIMDLLEYSRVGTNKEVFVMTDLNKVVRDVASVFIKPMDENQPEIKYTNLPEIIANRSQMTQLFQNLVGNAVKYKRTCKALVEIDYKEQDDHYLFSISDNGIGIEAMHFDRIFMLFQRLHLKTEFSGTGIGLTICKKIVERHGGAIWVESVPGQGSTFYFTIKKHL